MKAAQTQGEVTVDQTSLWFHISGIQSQRSKVYTGGVPMNGPSRVYAGYGSRDF
jgi:hypothetical protein